LRHHQTPPTSDRRCCRRHRTGSPLQQIAPQQADFATRLVDAFGHKRFQQLVDDLAAVSEVLDDVQP